MSKSISKLYGVVRLTGKDMKALRRQVFERDEYRCQHIISYLNPDTRFIPGVGIAYRYRRCEASVTWESGHLAHIISRARGGGDTAENTVCKCAECHLVREHNPKSVPPKERA